MSSINNFFPCNIQPNNIIPATYGNVCLKANANTELSGNTYTRALAINCDISAGHVLTLSGDTFLKGRTDVSGSLYVNGVSIISGGGGTQSLSSVLSYGNNAGTYNIDMSNNQVQNVSTLTMSSTASILGTNLDISGQTTINGGYYPGRLESINTNTVSSFSITIPLKNYYNFFQNGSTDVYLPNIASLRASQQTQITITKNGGTTLTIYCDPSNIMLSPGGTSITSYVWNTTDTVMMLNASVISGGTWRIVYQGIGLDQVLRIGNVASTNINMNGFGITSVQLVDASNITTQSLTQTGSRTAIPITSGTFDSPSYPTGNTVLYSGTGTYTGYSGWIFSGSASYSMQIVSGTGQSPFYQTYFTSGTQALVISPSTYATAATVTYYLQPGEYLCTFWVQAQNYGTPPSMSSAVKSGAGTLISISGIDPSVSYPNWIQYKMPFVLSTATNVWMEFTNTGGYICLDTVELTQINALLVIDSSGISAVGGSQVMLQNTYIANGLQVTSGGVSSVGGLSTNSTYGTNTLAINSTMGEIVGSNNKNSIAMGNGAMNFATGVGNTVAIGVACGASQVGGGNNVMLGYKTNAKDTSGCIIIGSEAGGANGCVVIGNIAGNINNGGAISNGTVAIGDHVFQRYNGFGTLQAAGDVAIGAYSQRNCADNYNTSVGCYSLYNMAGSNGITANGENGLITQYNTALGYNSGYTQYSYNQCTFVGANTDASTNNLYNSGAFGYNVKVDISNCLQIGNSTHLTRTGGKLYVAGGDISGITSINGVTYTPGGGSAGTLAQTLTLGNKANLPIDMSFNDLQNTGTLYATAISSNTGNLKVVSPLDMSGGNILNCNNINVSTINGSPLPTTPSLAAVLTVGNIAGKNIDMSYNSLNNVNAVNFIAGTGALNLNVGNINDCNQIQMGGTKLIDGRSGATITGFLSISAELFTQTQNNITYPDLQLQNINSSATTGVRLRTTKRRPINGLSANDTLYALETYGTDASNTLVQYAADTLTVVASTTGAHEAKRTISTWQVGSQTSVMDFGSNITAYRPIILNTIGIQNAYKTITMTANASYVSQWANYCGNHTFVSQTTQGWTLTIGSAVIYSGAICKIENISAFDLTLTSGGGNFTGSYGNGTTSYVVYPGQTMTFVSNSSDWVVNMIGGVPMTLRYVNTTTGGQTLSTAATVLLFPTLETASISATNGIKTWGATLLGYSSGTFTNNSGFPMTLMVQFTGIAASAANHRFIGVNYLNTTRNPYNRPLWVNFAAGGTQTMTISQIVHLGAGDTFNILGQVFTTATTINQNFYVTMTRIN